MHDLIFPQAANKFVIAVLNLKLIISFELFIESARAICTKSVAYLTCTRTVYVAIVLNLVALLITYILMIIYFSLLRSGLWSSLGAELSKFLDTRAQAILPPKSSNFESIFFVPNRRSDDATSASITKSR